MKIKCVVLLVTALFCGHFVESKDNDDSNPFMDIAASFLQETLSSQNGGGGNGLAGIASIIGNLVQPDSPSKSNNGGLDAAQIISGIGSLMAAANGGNGARSGEFDPSIIGNVIEMFTAGGESNTQVHSGSRNKRQAGGAGMDTILSIASAFMSNGNSVQGQTAGSEGLMSLLPMVLQAVNSFAGPEGEKMQAKHKDHAWVLPPFLEKVHIMWDHFSSSELAEAMWQKSGIDTIFKVRLSPVFTHFLSIYIAELAKFLPKQLNELLFFIQPNWQINFISLFYCRDSLDETENWTMTNYSIR